MMGNEGGLFGFSIKTISGSSPGDIEMDEKTVKERDNGLISLSDTRAHPYEHTCTQFSIDESCCDR